MNRIYVDKYTGKVERSDIYLVRLTLKDGTVIDHLEPRRLFPVTNSTMYITLLNNEEKEVAFIRDLDELDESSKNALEECFEEYYMIPKITSVDQCEEKFGSLKWFVQTNRGPISFRIRNRHADIKMLRGTNRIIVRDSNDNRYEIPDYTALDVNSKRQLFSFL